jgi:hypothetical protein
MKFDRMKRSKEIGTFGATNRRLAHARKAIARDKESWALFPEFVKFQTPEERIEAIDTGKLEAEIEHRREQAAAWRNARRCLAAIPDPLRTRLLQYWNSGPYPGNPTFLMGLLDAALVGRWNPEARAAELERCRMLGELTQEVSRSIAVPAWPWTKFQNRDQFFVKLHVAREIAQARKPSIFPPLESDPDADVFATCTQP